MISATKSKEALLLQMHYNAYTKIKPYADFPDKIFFHKKLLVILSLLLCCSTISCAADAKEKSSSFGVFTSTLDGRDFKKIISDPYREMNHARVSPDKNWITFSRFNKRKLFSNLDYS